jgi:hypothetical protein
MLVCIAQSDFVADIAQAGRCGLQLVTYRIILDGACNAGTSSEMSVECRHMEQGL